MPVYHITLHAYRSWSAAHRCGYVEHGKGIKPPNSRLANLRDAIATQEPSSFKGDVQSAVIHHSYEICSTRSWRLHALGTETTHLHLLVSTVQFVRAVEIAAKIKNILSLLLNQSLNSPGRKWFVRGQSTKPVKARKHFDYLVTEDFPK